MFGKLELKKTASVLAFSLLSLFGSWCIEDSFNEYGDTINNNQINTVDPALNKIQEAINLIKKYDLNGTYPVIEGQWKLLNSYFEKTEITNDDIIQMELCLNNITTLLQQIRAELLAKGEHIPEGVSEFLAWMGALVQVLQKQIDSSASSLNATDLEMLFAESLPSYGRCYAQSMCKENAIAIAQLLMRDGKTACFDLSLAA